MHPIIQKLLEFADWFMKRDRFPTLCITTGVVLMTPSSFEYITFVAGLFGNRYQPFANGVSISLLIIGFAMLALGVYLRLSFYYKDSKRKRTADLDEFYLTYHGLTAASKQIRFRAIYGILQDASITDTLMSHPTSPVLVVEDYKRAIFVIKRRDEWFDWKSKRHKAYENAYAITSLLLFLHGLFTVCLGGKFWFAPPSGPYGGWTGLAFAVAGVIAMLGAWLNLQDVAKYGAARRLIAAEPTAVLQ